MDRGHLEELLQSLVRSGGTTLHLLAGHVPWIRLHGRIVAAGGPVAPQVLADLVRDLLFADQRQCLESGEEVELVYTADSGERYRTTVSSTVDGLSLVFRRVPERAPTLEELGLPELVGSFCAFRRGLVLVSGFFDSGKSATVAAMIDRINEERSTHVVSIERQIECLHASRRSLVHQREIGTHVPSLADGVRDAFVQGADVIVAREMATGDDLVAVLDAAERGALVVATVEASCVAGAIAELLRLVPGDARARTRMRFADVLRVAFAQRLVRRRHGQGRVPLLEIVIRNAAVVRAICQGRLEQLPDVVRSGRGLGMQTADMALRQLLDRHVISPEEAAFHATDRDWVCRGTAPHAS